LLVTAYEKPLSALGGAAFWATFLSGADFYSQPRLILLSKKAKKAEGLEQHKKLQREKDQKRKERKQVSLPAKHAKGKK
jgi:hypothetical protein